MNNTNPYTTDFIALGLPDRCAFDVLKRPRIAPAVHKIPGKRGPRKQGKSIALPGSSKEREVKMLAIHTNSPAISARPDAADALRHARLTGKSRPNWREV